MCVLSYLCFDFLYVVSLFFPSFQVFVLHFLPDKLNNILLIPMKRKSPHQFIEVKNVQSKRKKKNKKYLKNRKENSFSLPLDYLQFDEYNINLNLVKLRALAWFRYDYCVHYGRDSDKIMTIDDDVLNRLYCDDFYSVYSLSSCHAKIDWLMVENKNPFQLRNDFVWFADRHTSKQKCFFFLLLNMIWFFQSVRYFFYIFFLRQIRATTLTTLIRLCEKIINVYLKFSRLRMQLCYSTSIEHLIELEYPF